MKFSIQETAKRTLLNELSTANLKFQKTYPGDRPDRQPVHTVYRGANLFKSDTCIKLGEIALQILQAYAPDFVTLARLLKLKGFEHLPHSESEIQRLTKKLERMNEEEKKTETAWLSYSVYNKIIQKLKREPVEDFRIDFEDG